MLITNCSSLDEYQALLIFSKQNLIFLLTLEEGIANLLALHRPIALDQLYIKDNQVIGTSFSPTAASSAREKYVYIKSPSLWNPT
jgi:hypothetical protein